MKALGVFQRLSCALGTHSAPALGSCSLRLASGTAAAAQSKPEPVMPDALDQVFDRGEDEVTAAQREAEFVARVEARRAAGMPDVDLDTEFDRDDPLLADKQALWDAPPVPPEVDLDTEMDRDDPLLADRSRLWDCPDPPCPANIDAEFDMNEEEYLLSPASGAGQQPPPEPAAAAGDSPAGTLAGNTPFGQGGKRAPEKPDGRIGQYRESP